MTPLKPATALILALLVVTLPACTDQSNSQQEVETAVPHTSPKECKPSVHPFWARFRGAVLKEDWEAVANLTEFPFDVYERSGRRNRLSREEFIKRLPEFLGLEPYYGYPGVEPKPASMKALIKAVPALPKDACGDLTNQMTVDLWSFGMTSEGWRFGRVDVPGPQYRR